MADTLNRIARIADTVSDNVKIAPMMTSISAQAAKSTYYFPILVSKNVTSKTAALLANNLESMYGYFMRACFSLTPAIKVKGDVNVEEYLKRFHQNSGISRNKFGIMLKEEVEEFKLLPNEPLNEAYNPGGPNSVEDRRYEKETRKIIIDVDDALGVPKAIDKIREKYDLVKGPDFANGSWTAGKLEQVNGMTPYVMPVTCQFLVEGHNNPVTVNIPIGIKVMLHPSAPEEINDRIADAIVGHGVIKSFVRWTSGEVESLGDMLFGTTRMKKNIAGDSKMDQWFDVIERRKRINKLSLGLAAKKPFLPNMTIHLSTYDVEEIERKTKVNLLKNINMAQRLVKECFLLALVITDEAYETAYILYDGHNDFEEIPFNTIKRENDKTADTMVSILKTFAGK